MALNINGTTGISGVDGSASAPAVTGTDSNTGINFASDTVNINTGGSTRATIDSNGRLGVGVTSPDQELHVKGSGTVATFEGTGGGGSIAIKDSDDGTVAFVVVDAGNFKVQTSGSSYSDKLVIDTSGQVGIGTTSPDRLLDVIKGGTNVARFQQTTNNQGSDHACITLRHAAALSGQDGVGMLFQNNGGSTVGRIDLGQSTTNYITSSDYRLKENVTAISDGITRLKTLKPYKFNWISDDTNTLVDGFFAHEVTAVPEAISGTKDDTQDILYTEEDTIPSGKKVGDVKETVPKYQGIDQSKLVPLLTAALQEAIAKIETLETKVAALEAA